MDGLGLLYIRSASKHKPTEVLLSLAFPHEGAALKASLQSEERQDELDQADRHCKANNAVRTGLSGEAGRDPSRPAGSVWMEQISKVTGLSCCARPLPVVHMAGCHFPCVSSCRTQSGVDGAAVRSLTSECRAFLSRSRSHYSAK